MLLYDKIDFVNSIDVEIEWILPICIICCFRYFLNVNVS